MDLIVRYVPPIKGSFVTSVVVSFFAVVLVLFLLFVQFGFWVIVIYSFVYAVLMLFAFLSLTRRNFIRVNEENGALHINKTFSHKEVSMENLREIELYEMKRAYILTIVTTDKTKNFSLSGSLSFEEPPFAPFLRKVERLKPNIIFGSYCHGILHGESKFNPWSPKMYFAYWTYMLLMIGYFLFSLMFIYILSLI